MRAKELGVTLMEVVVSTVLVAVIIVISLNTSAKLMQSHASELESVKAARWIGRFIDEISATPFNDLRSQPSFGPEGGELHSDRSTLDDQDDYHRYDRLAPQHLDGSPIDALSDWRLLVELRRVVASRSGLVARNNASADLHLIEVRLVAPSGHHYADTVITRRRFGGDNRVRASLGEIRLSGPGGSVPSSADRMTVRQLNLPVLP